MAGLADWLEDYRNWRGRQEWEQGKGWQDFFGGDPRAQEQFEKLSGFGTDAGGLVGMIKASHGSPHAFTKFDFSKIGTGEGAQAYGHGGYFAQGFDSPVAQKYAKDLANIDQFTGLQTAHANAKNQVARFGNDPEWAAEVIADTMRNYDPKDTQYAALADTLKFIKSGDYAKPLQDEGHLYNVELKWPDAAREAADPLGEHHLLDWFEPLSKQSEHVKKSLRDYATLSGKEHYVPEWSDVPVYIGEGISPDTRGKEFYEWLASQSLDIKGLASRELASSALKAFDVPGIKYWDEGSRGAGEGTRNYVMFDDALANIVSRNGVSLSDLLQNPQQLKSLNPTGSVFSGYNPAERASLPLGENITTLSETMGVSPDELITIYRGVPHDVSTINPGDFITTNQQLAKDYAGTGKVISQKVKASDILDDLNESLGEEYIYRPGLKKLLKK